MFVLTSQFSLSDGATTPPTISRAWLQWYTTIRVSVRRPSSGGTAFLGRRPATTVGAGELEPRCRGRRGTPVTTTAKNVAC
jgi:hypothetical protein